MATQTVPVYYSKFLSFLQIAGYASPLYPQFSTWEDLPELVDDCISEPFVSIDFQWESQVHSWNNFLAFHQEVANYGRGY